MKASKQFSIVLAATVLAFGVATLAPQQADASYGYKYTDSQRPPVSTPTGYVNPSMGSTVTVTDPAPATGTNKLTTPVTSNNVTIESVNTANVAPKYSDYNDIAAYSLAVADYFMAKIMAIYGNGNTALNRYGFGK
ncbi:hypothetical protein [uncultured Veillonella sp.]|uniref:hypothetical protein n=1 Tax=uncultured Veillonella sp. TaxID=159268 RepID=UPI00280445C4|nr:hypothetical protein [uncultured Veillonella sp.]